MRGGPDYPRGRGVIDSRKLYGGRIYGETKVELLGKTETTSSLGKLGKFGGVLPEGRCGEPLSRGWIISHPMLHLFPGPTGFKI